MTTTIEQATVSVDDIRHLATVTVPTAAAFLKISKNHYYAGVKAGTLPGLTLGRCIRVPVQPLLELVGINPAVQAAA